jgi:hypothetical protein
VFNPESKYNQIRREMNEMIKLEISKTVFLSRLIKAIFDTQSSVCNWVAHVGKMFS